MTTTTEKLQNQLENMGTRLIETEGKALPEITDGTTMLMEKFLALQEASQRRMEEQFERRLAAERLANEKANEKTLEAFGKKPKAVKVKSGYSIEEGFSIEHGDIITFDSRDYNESYAKGDKPIWEGTIEAAFHGFIVVKTNKGYIPKMLVEVVKDNGSKKKIAGSIQALNLEAMVNLKVIK